MILESVIPALLPVVSDGLRGLFNRVTGGAGAKPANVEETISLMGAETKRLEALAQLDSVGSVSQWVANIRAMQRPAASAIVLMTYAGAVVYNVDESLISELGAYAQMVVFYLFGDRTYMYLQRGKK